MQGAEDQMPRQRGLGGNVSRFQISNFTNHDDIRGLTQNGAQGQRKRQTHVPVHLNLIDTRHLVFHRILHRNDLTIRAVDMIEAGIQRRRFSRSRGTCHQNNSIWQSNQTFKLLLVIGEETKFRQP